MAKPAVKATESPKSVTLTGGPEYWVPAALVNPAAASAGVGRVASTVTKTTARNAPEVVTQARHSVNDRIRPRRIGSSTR